VRQFLRQPDDYRLRFDAVIERIRHTDYQPVKYRLTLAPELRTSRYVEALGVDNLCPQHLSATTTPCTW
jgi:hypothetical protein